MQYGIPQPKIDKNIVQDRIDMLREEGVTVVCGNRGNVGSKSGVSWEKLGQVRWMNLSPQFFV